MIKLKSNIIIIIVFIILIIYFIIKLNNKRNKTIKNKKMIEIYKKYITPKSRKINEEDITKYQEKRNQECQLPIPPIDSKNISSTSIITF
jgi:predicted Holliday junction resolvase-like endonuclease